MFGTYIKWEIPRTPSHNIIVITVLNPHIVITIIHIPVIYLKMYIQVLGNHRNPGNTHIPPLQNPQFQMIP